MQEAVGLAVGPKTARQWLQPGVDITLETEQKLQRLLDEDLDFLVEQLNWKDGYAEEVARNIVEEYRKWIACLALAGDPIFAALYFNVGKLCIGMPSKHVDNAWHRHILFTREYAEFCQRVTGKMIHHRPCTKVTLASMQTDHFAIVYGNAFGEMPQMWCESERFIGEALAGATETCDNPTAAPTELVGASAKCGHGCSHCSGSQCTA